MGWAGCMKWCKRNPMNGTEERNPMNELGHKKPYVRESTKREELGRGQCLGDHYGRNPRPPWFGAQKPFFKQQGCVESLCSMWQLLRKVATFTEHSQ